VTSLAFLAADPSQLGFDFPKRGNIGAFELRKDFGQIASRIVTVFIHSYLLCARPHTGSWGTFILVRV
jgi:hypothetical protein